MVLLISLAKPCHSFLPSSHPVPRYSPILLLSLDFNPFHYLPPTDPIFPHVILSAPVWSPVAQTFGIDNFHM